MKTFNGFKAIVMASVVIAMASVSGLATAMNADNDGFKGEIVIESSIPVKSFAEFQAKKTAYAQKKAGQLICEWTALSFAAFVAKRACESEASRAIPSGFHQRRMLKAARVFRGVSRITAIPLMGGAGLVAMVILPAMALTETAPEFSYFRSYNKSE